MHLPFALSVLPTSIDTPAGEISPIQPQSRPVVLSLFLRKLEEDNEFLVFPRGRPPTPLERTARPGEMDGSPGANVLLAWDERTTRPKVEDDVPKVLFTPPSNLLGPIGPVTQL